MRKLTQRQLRFIEEYLTSGNGAAAARRAGYAKAHSDVIAAQNLVKVSIRAEIERRRKAIADRHEINRNRIIHEAATIAFSSPKMVMEWGPDYINLWPSDEIDFEADKQIKRLKIESTKRGTDVEIVFQDKIKALRFLADILGYLDKSRPVEREEPKFDVERIQAAIDRLKNSRAD